MEYGESDLLKILASETFSSILKKDCIKVAELHAIIGVLIECNIPFEIKFFQCTNTCNANCKIIVFLTAATVITFSMSFS